MVNMAHGLRLLLITLLFLAADTVCASVSPTIVVDADTGAALPKATVIDSDGRVAGICSDNGQIPALTPGDYPITIQYIGYEPVTILRPRAGQIAMHATPFSLQEIEIVSTKPQVLLIQGYLREYSTLTTSVGEVMMFREKSVDFMIPLEKTKKFAGWQHPRVLSSRSYYRFTNPEGLDSVSNTFSQHFSWSDWVGIFKTHRLPDSLIEKDNATDTVMGKYMPSQIWNKNNDFVTLDVDMLASRENLDLVPRMALFMGNGNDFTRFSMKYQFSDVTTSRLTPDNLSQMSYNIESSRSGRDMHSLSFREQPLYVNTYAELYITDRRYISLGEARRLEKQPPTDDYAAIIPPAEAPSLPWAVEDLVDRVNNIDHDQRRGTAEADHRYIAKPNKERFSIIGTAKKIAKRIASIIG